MSSLPVPSGRTQGSSGADFTGKRRQLDVSILLSTFVSFWACLSLRESRIRCFTDQVRLWSLRGRRRRTKQSQNPRNLRNLRESAVPTIKKGASRSAHIFPPYEGGIKGGSTLPGIACNPCHFPFCFGGPESRVFYCYSVVNVIARNNSHLG